MDAQPLKFMLPWRRFASEKRKTAGFTLIELLVSTSIAGIVISSLMYLVAYLLQVNPRESAQSETQRDMQIALDFMNSELQKAVYVYGGDCLQGQTIPTFCPGITNHVPVPTNSVPILAFWKLDPLPTAIQNACTSNTVSEVSCNSDRTYTLVVYFLSKDKATIQQSGRAEIVRYTMAQYDSNGNVNSNYVDPTQNGVSFSSWPYQENGQNNMHIGGKPIADRTNTAVLVDFVDDTPRLGDNKVTCPSTKYVLTPSSNTLNGSIFTGVRSFYACVRTGSIYNQDVLVFLRGNASGRVGVSDNSFLPTLQTQVLSRRIASNIPVDLTLHEESTGSD